MRGIRPLFSQWQETPAKSTCEPKSFSVVRQSQRAARFFSVLWALRHGRAYATGPSRELDPLNHQLWAPDRLLDELLIRVWA